MDILKELNEKQRQAVLHKTGPILVLAGPGTGKTKVITHRVVYLIRECGIEPQNILAVTFTNRAAKEMRDRISRSDMLGYEHAQNLWIDTFHAASVKILRENAEECGLNPNFTIFDQEIQNEILEECIHSLRLSTESYPIWQVKDIISFYKGRCVDPSEVPPEQIRSRDGEIFVEDEEKRENFHRNIVEIINAYRLNLKKYDAFDFDDLIVSAVKMLSDFPEIRDKYQQNLRHVMVDEYQDINTAQYSFLKLLCGDQKVEQSSGFSNPQRADLVIHNERSDVEQTDGIRPLLSLSNVMVVADDDQAIYSWRGSEPAYIDHFKDDFNPKIIELEEHYRSSQTILDAAQALIEKNTRRKTGKLVTNRSEDHLIHHYILEDVNSEAGHIIKIIRKLHKELHRGHNEIAIFYRKHHLVDKLEAELRKAQIPVVRIRARNSLTAGHIRSIMSYLNVMAWNLDRDVENAINFPQRLIDRFTMTKLKWISRRDDLLLGELFEKIDDYKNEVSALARQNIKNFVSDMEDFQNQIDEDEVVIGIANKLLSFIGKRRSAYQDEELGRIWKNDKADTSNDTIAQAVKKVSQAIDQQLPITITAIYGLDHYCAAYIISQTLKTYFGIDAEIRRLKEGKELDEIFHKNSQAVHLVIGEFKELSESKTKQKARLTHHAIRITQRSGLTSLTALNFCRRLLEDLSERSYDGVVVYDLETIGNNPKKAQILQIGAIALDQGGEPKEAFNRLVKPPGRIPLSSTRIHGITNEMVADKSSIEGVLPDFMRFIGDKILVGHNIIQFDNPLIDRELRNGMDRGLVNQSCDTMEMQQELSKRESYNLEFLAKKFGIDYKDAHQADADARITLQIFKELVKIDHRSCVIRSLSEFLPLIGISILAGVSRDEIEEPKSLPGAYYRAAVRYVQRNSAKISIDTLKDWLDKKELQNLENNLDLLKAATLTQSEKDIAWQNLSSNFLNNVGKFENNTTKPKLSDFLDYQKLITGSDEAEIEKSVALMTLHSAKGTEFPFVFMIGMEDGVFPKRRKDDLPEKLEEERRLCYVGMTRAKERLYFSTVTRRDVSLFERDASLFVREIPDEFINRWRDR